MSEAIPLLNSLSRLIILLLHEATSHSMPILSKFLKHCHISKSRVFEKRFSQLHLAAFCLLTVKNLFRMSQAISLKITVFQTVRNISPESLAPQVLSNILKLSV